MFAKRLKQLRAERNLLQKEVADYLGITTSAYGFYEQGEREPSLETLKRLADYFAVSVDYLLGRTNIHTPLPEKVAEKPSNWATSGKAGPDEPLPDDLLNHLEKVIQDARRQSDLWKKQRENRENQEET